MVDTKIKKSTVKLKDQLMCEDIIFDIPNEEWNEPTEYCIHHHTFIIQNTHKVRKARENILSFMKKHYHDTGISLVESSDMKCILFDKCPYTYPNVGSQQEDEKEYLRKQKEKEEQKEVSILEIDDIFTCSGIEVSGLSIKWDETELPFPNSFEEAFDCSIETEESAGLETLSTYLGPIQEIKNKNNNTYGTIHFNYRYYIGDGNDSLIDKSEVLEKIILCDFIGAKYSFYEVKEDGTLENVGTGLEGASKLFHLSPKEIRQAKELLATQYPEYASYWKEELRKEKIRIYDEYLKENKQRVKDIKALMFSHGAINLCPKNPNQFTMGGIQYKEINEFLNCQYLFWNDFGYSSTDTCRKYWLQQNANGQIMLVKNERYPCFDSYDYASEDRYYTTCILCDDIEDAYKKSCLLAFEELGSSIPKLMGQILYYDSGKNYLATSKSAKITDKNELFNHILQAIEEFKQFNRNAPESPYH